MRRRALLSGGSAKKDYSQDYFTMVVTTGGGIIWTGSTTDNTLSYSKDNGSTWNTADSGTTISIAAGDRVLWKGTPTPQSNGIGKFSGNTNVRYSVKGNVMSLLYGDNFKGQTSLSGKNYALSNLFSGNKNVTSANNLSLPATTLATRCYKYMFKGCTSLTTAPELPATTLATECYSYMFSGCTSLTTAPELPATTLAERCYSYMFACTNILPDCTNIDFSSQSVVASGGLQGLFSETKITDAQLDAILKEHGINNYSLPVTTLVIDCYVSMFSDCTNLTTAPELPATTAKSACYQSMFAGCSNLTKAPKLPATTLGTYCYYGMFSRCKSLTTAPELLVKTLREGCYNAMFQGCTKLSSIKCLATDISAYMCTTDWVTDVAKSGTFTKAASMEDWPTGTSGIPSGWTVQNNVVEPVVLYPEDYDTPVSGYINSTGKWAKATSSVKQTWVFHDVTEFQGGTCNLYLDSRTGYYAFVKQIPTAAGSVQYASGWSNRATLSQDIADIPIPSDAVYLCFYYHGSNGDMYPSKVEIYPQE